MFLRFNPLLLAVALCAGWFSAGSDASVVMIGTRVIYNAGARDKTIQLTNNDDQPNLVQVWVDSGNPDSTPDNADAPFVATPQVFRMEPHVGQMVRLMFTGAELPQDRETVFYLNFKQVPAIKAKDADANRLVLMFGNRLKLFYRPKGLAGSPDDLPKKLTLTVHGSGESAYVQLDNPTPYHAVVRSARLKSEAGKDGLLADGVMVAPGASVQWRIPGSLAGANRFASVRLVLVNDYGADVATDIPLQ